MTKNGSEIHTQYRLIHDVYLLMDYGDSLVLNEFRLTSSQMNILTLLNQEDGHRLTEISNAVFRSKSTITRAIDQLEARALVQRVSDSDDRRAQQVVLTEDGEIFREEVSAKLMQSLVKRFGIMTAEELRIMTNLMSKLRQGLSQRID